MGGLPTTMDANFEAISRRTTLPGRNWTSYVLGLMRKMSAATNAPMSEATAAVYLEQLAPYSELQLTEAIDQVIQNWMEPSKLPPVAVILECLQARILEAQLERQKIEVEL